MSTPDFMPVLTGGCHARPEQGACVMEYVSFIKGGRFTDSPECTPEDLSYLAQYVNDSMHSDESRSRLLSPLIPRLLGEGPSRKFDEHLREWLIGQARTEWKDVSSPTGRISTLASRVLPSHPMGLDEFEEHLADLLIRALDEYDKFLGRDKPAELTPDEVASVEKLHALITTR